MQIDICLASVEPGGKDGDDAVKGAHWFGVARFRTASFVSSSVRTLGGGRYEAVGTLCLKAARRELRATLNVRQESAGAQFEGGFTLNCLRYKIGDGV